MDSRRNANPDTLPFRVTFTNAAKQEQVLAAFRLESDYKDFIAHRHEWAGSENGPSYCSICGHPGDI